MPNQEGKSDVVMFDKNNPKHKTIFIQALTKKHGMILSNSAHVAIAKELCERAHDFIESTEEAVKSWLGDVNPVFAKPAPVASEDVPW
jgi:hypothetical protein